MDRKIFKLPFINKGVTRYKCPSCGSGFLQVKNETFNQHETKNSLKAHDHPAWEPEWIEFIYSCLLECTNTACKAVVSSSGIGSVEEEYYQDEYGQTEQNYGEYFSPQYFTPHLEIFNCPKETPEEVEKEIKKSFSLLFNDPASSANHIRVALEHLLTHLKIKRYTRKNGKLHFVPLHNRIDLLPPKFNHIKDIFIAVKWLGNAGSHSAHEVTLDDVLDSYELIQELLDEIFSTKRKKAQNLAKRINKKKGPK